MSNAKRAALVLQIVLTDNTFHKESVQGAWVWVGRCIHCRSKLVVALGGETGPEVTIEHIVPKNHEGTDDPKNLALACAQCNSEKGVRHDHKNRKDPRRLQVELALTEQRKKRWREPSE